MVKKRLWVIILVLVSIFGVLLGLNAPFLTALAKQIIIDIPDDPTDGIVLLLDFRDYEVDNFDDYKKMLRSTTDKLNVTINGYVEMESKFSSCPSAEKDVTLDLELTFTPRTTKRFRTKVPCTTSYSYFYYLAQWELDEDLSKLVKDTLYSGNELPLNILYRDQSTAPFSGVTRLFRSLKIASELEFSFGTTYFYDTIFYDVNYNSWVISQNWDYYIPMTNFYTKMIVSDSSYSKVTLVNQDPTDLIDRGRVKYAFELEDKRLTSNYLSTTNEATWDGYEDPLGFIYRESTLFYLYTRQSTYQFNLANQGANFPAASTSVGLSYIDPCPIWNMECGVNNLLTYLVKDAPILSDLSALIGSGWSILSNSFYAFTGLLGVYLGANFENLNIFVIIIGVAVGISIIIWAVRDL